MLLDLDFKVNINKINTKMDNFTGDMKLFFVKKRGDSNNGKTNIILQYRI